VSHHLSDNAATSHRQVFISEKCRLLSRHFICNTLPKYVSEKEKMSSKEFCKMCPLPVLDLKKRHVAYGGIMKHRFSAGQI